ncbi:MAG: RidA family protein [Gammaproteobacteria bacterium]|nr:RidA family protein [Gammaproteobacteria bacterium]
MTKVYINPEELFPSLQYGFSQITTSDSGKLVFLSGQVGWDENQKFPGSSDFRSQTIQTLKNIDTAMTKAGGSLSDIVSLRIYIVGENFHNDHHISNELKNYFPENGAPSSTWVRVVGLAKKELLIEIEAIAVINE